MLQSTITKAALCAAGGAVAAMTAAGPAAAVQDTTPVVPAKSVPGDLMSPQGGGKVHKGIVKRHTKIHKKPSKESRVIGFLRKGEIIKIKCKVVKHRDWHKETWFKLAWRPGWVNARDVKAFDRIPHCRFNPMPSVEEMENAQELPALNDVSEPVG